MNPTKKIHWMNDRDQRLRLGTAALLTTLLTASLSGASIPNAAGQIILCYYPPGDVGLPPTIWTVDEDLPYHNCAGGLRIVVNQRATPGPAGPQGPAGPKGPAGPQGVPGPGIGRTIRRTTMSALGTHAGDHVEMQLGCNTGETLLSGGYYASNPAAPYSVQESYPADDNLWHLYIRSNQDLTANMTLTILCTSP